MNQLRDWFAGRIDPGDQSFQCLFERPGLVGVEIAHGVRFVGFSRRQKTHDPGAALIGEKITIFERIPFVDPAGDQPAVLQVLERLYGLRGR